jgi:hypothetical protein
MAAFDGAARALRDGAGVIVERWLAAVTASPLRVPGRVEVRVLAGPARGIVAALALALDDPACAPGSHALREVEKLVAFTGGSLGMAGATAFDVVAVVTGLRDALSDAAVDAAERQQLGRLFDWLIALALEGYATSRLDALRLRYRDSLERGTPVVMITRELPAALLVGDPDRAVLEAVFGRLLLALVRVGARAVILDGGGLVAPDGATVLDALGVFARHPKLAAVACILVGLQPAAETSWRAAFPPAIVVSCEERFDDAVARALRIVTRRDP